MTWLRNRGVRTKILLGFIVVVAVLSGVALYGLNALGQLQAASVDTYTNRVVPLEHLGDAQAGVLKVRAAVLQHLLATDAEVMKKLEARIAELDAAVDKDVKGYTAAQLPPAAQKPLEEFQKAWPAYRAIRDGQVLAQSREGKKAEAIAMAFGAAGQAMQAVLTPLDRLSNVNVEAVAEATRAGAAQYASTRLVMTGAILVAIALSIMLGLLLARAIARPLGATVTVLQAVADGDFTPRLAVTGTDEVGRMAVALNQAIEAMSGALSEVRTVAETAAGASRELASAADQLASGSQEQASSLEETAASLEQITGTVKQNADNARSADRLAAGSRETAEKGRVVVEQAVESMSQINQSSKKIADIITAIDEIAFQTNLLALNAAVEAARAGEQGRGFAVVATEVRNLAQRSATAAKEIKTLIGDSVGKVEAGSDLVNRSGATLQEIVGSVKRVTDIIGEIAAASQEQSTGIDQVNRAVTQMDQVVQATAAQTEELSSTAQALAEQSERLQAMLRRFQLADGPQPPVPVAPQLALPAPKAAPAAKAAKPIPRPITRRAAVHRQADDHQPAPTRAARAATPKPEPAELVGAHANGRHDGFEEFWDVRRSTTSDRRGE